MNSTYTPTASLPRKQYYCHFPRPVSQGDITFHQWKLHLKSVKKTTATCHIETWELHSFLKTLKILLPAIQHRSTWLVLSIIHIWCLTVGVQKRVKETEALWVFKTPLSESLKCLWTRTFIFILNLLGRKKTDINLGRSTGCFKWSKFSLNLFYTNTVSVRLLLSCTRYQNSCFLLPFSCWLIQLCLCVYSSEEPFIHHDE